DPQRTPPAPANRTGSWDLPCPPLAWRPSDSPPGVQTPSAPRPVEPGEGLVFLARQAMPHAKATPAYRLPLGEQMGNHANRVTKQFLLHQEAEKFLGR